MSGKSRQNVGDLERMELLFEKFYHKLYLYAFTFIDDEDEAKDIVGDVFQMVWEDWTSGRSRYQDPSASFFYTAVRNRCLDTLRHAVAIDRYEKMLKATESLTTDDSVAAFEQRIVKLREAIAVLPEPGQTVLQCVYFKDLSYKQTAEHLGISVNMVHKHMVKVFRLLRENVGHVDVLLWFLISVSRQCF